MTDNLYAPPQVDLAINGQAVGKIEFFSPSSRLNRLRYWAHLMLAFLALLLALGAAGIIGASVSINAGFAVGALAYLAFLVFSIIVVIQRLHDLDKSGWLCLLGFIPLVNLYLAVLVIFMPGTPGPNRFGLPTPPVQKWHWVAALAFPVLSIVFGIIAAISMPAYQKFTERANQPENAPLQAPDINTPPATQ